MPSYKSLYDDILTQPHDCDITTCTSPESYTDYLDIEYTRTMIKQLGFIKPLFDIIALYPEYMDILIGILCAETDEEDQEDIIISLVEAFHRENYHLGSRGSSVEHKNYITEILATVLFAWGDPQTAIQVIIKGDCKEGGIKDLADIMVDGTPSSVYLDATLEVTRLWKIYTDSIEKDEGNSDPYTQSYNIPDIVVSNS